MTHARWRPIPLTRQVLADFRRGWRPLVAYDIVCKFLTTAALAPLLAAFLNLLISSSGDPAVSNYALIAFFLSWQGVLLVVVMATIEFARTFFELGGLALIGIGLRHGVQLSSPQTMRFLAARIRQLMANAGR